MTGKVIIQSEEVKKLIEKLADEITGNGKNLGEIAIVGIHRRGVPIAQRIADIIQKHRNIMPELGSLDITLYRDDLSSTPAQPEVHGTQIEFDISGKRVVLVDDVLYTGRTVRAALSEIADFGRPHRIELAVLVDRGLHELPIRADYVGQTFRTKASQMVEVRLEEIDGEDKVLLVDMEE